MSKLWATNCTSGTPNFSMAAVSSYSLPKPQLPTGLPAQSEGWVMPESAQDTIRVPERWNTWPTLTSPAPSSLETKALGTQARPNSAPPVATTCWGTISTAPSRMVTFRPSSS